MADTYLDVDASTGFPKRRTSTDTSSGGASAGKIVSLDGSGKISSTMMPAGIGASTATAIASESIAAGDFVQLYDNSSVKTMRKANATDSTKLADGFVIEAVSSSASGIVYLDGQNPVIPVGAFVAADVGKTVFLATTAGAMTITPPSSAGNVIQRLGEIIDVGGSLVAIESDISAPILL